MKLTNESEGMDDLSVTKKSSSTGKGDMEKRPLQVTKCCLRGQGLPSLFRMWSSCLYESMEHYDRKGSSSR